MKRTYFSVTWTTRDSRGGLREYAHIFEGDDAPTTENQAKTFARQKANKSRIYYVKIFRFDAVRINDRHEATTATNIAF